jgi:hypothetical protein
LAGLPDRRLVAIGFPSRRTPIRVHGYWARRSPTLHGKGRGKGRLRQEDASLDVIKIARSRAQLEQRAVPVRLNQKLGKTTGFEGNRLLPRTRVAPAGIGGRLGFEEGRLTTSQPTSVRYRSRSKAFDSEPYVASQREYARMSIIGTVALPWRRAISSNKNAVAGLATALIAWHPVVSHPNIPWAATQPMSSRPCVPPSARTSRRDWPSPGFHSLSNVSNPPKM